MTPLELTAARKVLHLSQAALARALGVSLNTTNRWEKGARPIPPYLHLALLGLQAMLTPNTIPALFEATRVATAADRAARNAAGLGPYRMPK